MSIDSRMYALYKKSRDKEWKEELDECPDCKMQPLVGKFKFRKLCHMHEIVEKNNARREDDLDRYVMDGD